MEQKNYEEISVRELIRILYKHRILIISAIGISLLLSFTYAFLIAESMYTAKADIAVTDIGTGVTSFDRENDPKTVIDVYLKWMNDLEFMDKVSRKLQSENINLDKNALNSIISATKGKDGVSMSITALHKEKDEAAPIANAAVAVLSEEASVYIRELIKQQITITEEQVRLGEESYQNALAEYKKYVSNPESLSKIQSRIDVLESVLVQLKANLMSGNYGQGISKQQLEKDIAEKEEKLNALHELLVDASYMDRALKRELNSSLSIFEARSEEVDKFRLAEEYYQEGSNIKIMSYATEPNSPISPKRKDIIILSLLAGACIGVLATFTIEYIRKTK